MTGRDRVRLLLLWLPFLLSAPCAGRALGDLIWACGLRRGTPEQAGYEAELAQSVLFGLGPAVAIVVLLGWYRAALPGAVKRLWILPVVPIFTGAAVLIAKRVVGG